MGHPDRKSRLRGYADCDSAKEMVMLSNAAMPSEVSAEKLHCPGHASNAVVDSSTEIPSHVMYGVCPVSSFGTASHPELIGSSPNGLRLLPHSPVDKRRRSDNRIEM